MGNLTEKDVFDLFVYNIIYIRISFTGLSRELLLGFINLTNFLFHERLYFFLLILYKNLVGC